MLYFLLIIACIWGRCGIFLICHVSRLLLNSLTHLMAKWLTLDLELAIVSYENRLLSAFPTLTSFSMLFLFLFYGFGGWREW